MLEVRGACGGYGLLTVVKGVNLSVSAGEFVALLGPNGAGKSTLLKMVAGLVECRPGHIMLNDSEITNLSPQAILRRKISLVPEGREIFGPLSVLENLELGAYHRRHDRDARRAIMEDLKAVFDLFPILAQRRTQPAGTLSGGEQQMLAIGRAVMSAPELLLLDEPSMGLGPKVVGTITDALNQLRTRGLTLLLVEQNATVALQLVDRAYIMRTGEIVLHDASANLRQNSEVMRIYLGSS
jgi:branched-chain amino acid transport system ATP-binding protein